MKKKRTYIALFMFVPLIVMLLHSFIPHHHHNIQAANQECSIAKCHENHSDNVVDFQCTSDEEQDCDVCHFNTETIHKDNISKSFIAAYLLIIDSAGSEQHSDGSFEYVSYYQKQHISYYPLRAPPAGIA